MHRRLSGLSCSFVVLAAAALAEAQDEAAIRRGEYVFRASGGCSCHRDPGNTEFSLAGGRPVGTPFGVIYGTNITPDRDTGIGAWTDDDFIRAMTEGVGPDGKDYYPVFPYTSFTRMKREDLLDLKAYLASLPAAKKPNREPELGFPFNLRTSVKAWKALYLKKGEYEPNPGESEEWNRGAYISTALAHCGECHTPRTTMGGPDESLYYAGSVEGPEGELAPNITPDEKTGIGSWDVPDVSWFLQTGFKPEGDDAQGLMGEIITQGYQHLEDADLKAIAVYLKSLKPIVNEVKAPPKDE
jgi:mono/diheme cytochrome c family protein